MIHSPAKFQAFPLSSQCSRFRHFMPQNRIIIWTLPLRHFGICIFFSEICGHVVGNFRGSRAPWKDCFSCLAFLETLRYRWPWRPLCRRRAPGNRQANPRIRLTEQVPGLRTPHQHRLLPLLLWREGRELLRPRHRHLVGRCHLLHGRQTLMPVHSFSLWRMRRNWRGWIRRERRRMTHSVSSTRCGAFWMPRASSSQGSAAICCLTLVTESSDRRCAWVSSVVLFWTKWTTPSARSTRCLLQAARALRIFFDACERTARRTWLGRTPRFTRWSRSSSPVWVQMGTSAMLPRSRTRPIWRKGARSIVLPRKRRRKSRQARMSCSRSFSRSSRSTFSSWAQALWRLGSKWSSKWLSATLRSLSDWRIWRAWKLGRPRSLVWARTWPPWCRGRTHPGARSWMPLRRSGSSWRVVSRSAETFRRTWHEWRPSWVAMRSGLWTTRRSRPPRRLWRFSEPFRRHRPCWQVLRQRHWSCSRRRSSALWRALVCRRWRRLRCSWARATICQAWWSTSTCVTWQRRGSLCSVRSVTTFSILCRGSSCARDRPRLRLRIIGPGLRSRRTRETGRGWRTATSRGSDRESTGRGGCEGGARQLSLDRRVADGQADRGEGWRQGQVTRGWSHQWNLDGVPM